MFSFIYIVIRPILILVFTHELFLECFKSLDGDKLVDKT